MFRIWASDKVRLHFPEVNHLVACFFQVLTERIRGFQADGGKPVSGPEEIQALVSSMAEASLQQLEVPLQAEVTVDPLGGPVQVDLDLCPALMAFTPSDLVH